MKMRTDVDIQNDVIEELKSEPRLNYSEIGVAVRNGVVTLSGTVDAYSKKVDAEIAAKKVKGVKVVAEDIEVKLLGISQCNDSDIAQAALDSLKWHSAVKQDKIKVLVDSGIVMLEGEVDWEYQRESAQIVVENLTGVRGILNSIRIKPSISPKDIQKKISEAFQRNAILDSERVHVEIIGSKAIIRGKVYSWFEKNEAEKVVWTISGIDRVENKIEVDSEVLMFY
jgi:osmotically-inducible protein OsmY